MLKIGANVRFSFAKRTSRVYYNVRKMACFAGFLMGRKVAGKMLTRAHGMINFTGTSARLGGSESYSAFSGAEHALRALAQSMARELGTKNIHLTHTLIDGAIGSRLICEE